MERIEYAKNQLNRFYLDIIESRRTNPSYPFIESYSEVLLDVIVELRKNNTVMDITLHSIWRNADIFNADLIGELHHDYKKQNKRYRDKWLVQKRKIDGITGELFEYLNKINDSTEASF